MLSPKFIFFRFLQKEKAFLFSLFKSFPKSTSVKDVQSEKQYSPNDITLSQIITVSKLLQYLNAKSSMRLIFAPKFIFRRLLQKQNEYSPMYFTVSGIVTVLI